jgi:acetyl-CoA acetyltransferase
MTQPIMTQPIMMQPITKKTRGDLKMTYARKVYVLGGDHSTFIGKHHPDFIWPKHPQFGQRENPTIAEHLKAAVDGALASAGVSPADVERGFVGNFAGELFVKQGHMGAMAAGLYPEFNYKPFMRIEGACASGGLALAAAIDAIQAGADVVLVCGSEVQTTVSAREGADFLARAADYATERGLDDFTFPCMFARRNKAYKEAFNTDDSGAAHVTAKAYKQAAQNPRAHMRAVKVSYEQALTASNTNPNFLNNPDYRDHLKISDCSQVSDGASALILVSEAALAKYGKTPADAVEVLACAQASASLSGPRDLTRLDTTAHAAQRAYAEAGVSPAEVQVAEVHDCFAITEVMMYEALGFAPTGEGWKLAASGATALGGKLPVNTGGGLLAFGHPVGATGVKQVVEVCRQMRGLCGDYQMTNRPSLGLAANMGGDDRTAVITVLRQG